MRNLKLPFALLVAGVLSFAFVPSVEAGPDETPTPSTEGANGSADGKTRGRRARLFTRGVVIAVSIFMFSHFMMVLGATMRLPAYVAGWAPACIVALAGAVMLARMDEA